MVGVSKRSAGTGVRRDGKIHLSNQPLAPKPKAPLLSCPPSAGRPPHARPRAKRAAPCEIVRTRVKPLIAASAQAICARTGHRHAMVLPLDVQSSCSTLAADLHRTD